MHQVASNLNLVEEEEEEMITAEMIKPKKKEVVTKATVPQEPPQELTLENQGLRISKDSKKLLDKKYQDLSRSQNPIEQVNYSDSIHISPYRSEEGGSRMTSPEKHSGFNSGFVKDSFISDSQTDEEDDDDSCTEDQQKIDDIQNKYEMIKNMTYVSRK